MHSLWTLNSNQSILRLLISQLHILILELILKHLSHMRKIFVLTACIDDHIDMIAVPRDHRIIINTSVCIHNQRKTCLAWFQLLKVHYSHSFHKLLSILPSKSHLSHMRNIKETCVLSDSVMFMNKTFLVLYWHLVSSERNYFSSKGSMVVEEDCGLVGLG